MRLIGTIYHQADAALFSHFLKSKSIQHHVDTQKNQDWESSDYGLVEFHFWIREEDQVVEAKRGLDLFLINPHDAAFSGFQTSSGIAAAPLLDSQLQFSNLPNSSLKEQNMSQAIPWSKQAIGWITRILIIICSLLMVLSELLLPQINSEFNAKQVAVFTSPVSKNLLYDYPYYYELVDQYLQLSKETTDSNLSKETQTLLKKISQTSSWQGFYPLLASKESENSENLSSTPQFEKIKEGQIWRLFTPALLHADLFHLFFNMLWLIVLGKQIEQRLTSWSYLFFLLIIGVFSNTLQYLATGPNFIGISGILCGMLTFIWERGKIAPWEGYELNRMTYLFMMVFILGMASIQLFAFFMEKSFNMNFSPNVANTAHLSGALIGYLIGKTNIFSWRHS